jgi:branched-chain amino acid transport system ATP-binding protein
LMLEVDELSAHYGAIEALRSVTLRVDESEIVALIGPNGAGKTTTLASIMGLVRSKRGSIRFEGQEIGTMQTEDIVRRGLSLVPERRRLWGHLTVEENLRMGAAVRRRKGIEEDLEMLLDLFPILRERLHESAGHLSGGEAQQLAFARAIMSAPRLLLLDEPSLGLGPILVETLFRLVRDLRERGYTILVVEQNAARALDVADRAYLLRSGWVETHDAAERLRDDRTLLEAYLGARENGGRR